MIKFLDHFSWFDSPFLQQASAQQRCEQRGRLRRQFVWQIGSEMR